MTVESSSIQPEKIQHIAAFADGCVGGNPAGVYVAEQMPSEAEMRALAARLGYSETVFAEPQGEPRHYRARYFSPESEVPFCGHATIALGKVLGQEAGDGVFQLQLNDAEISVEVLDQNGFQVVALQSPPTRSEPADAALVSQALALFSLTEDDLDARFGPALAHGGGGSSTADFERPREASCHGL